MRKFSLDAQIAGAERWGYYLDRLPKQMFTGNGVAYEKDLAAAIRRTLEWVKEHPERWRDTPDA